MSGTRSSNGQAKLKAQTKVRTRTADGMVIKVDISGLTPKGLMELARAPITGITGRRHAFEGQHINRP